MSRETIEQVRSDLSEHLEDCAAFRKAIGEQLEEARRAREDMAEHLEEAKRAREAMAQDVKTLLAVMNHSKGFVAALGWFGAIAIAIAGVFAWGWDHLRWVFK